MNSEDTGSDSTVAHQNEKNLIRSQYYDVMVKVDGDIYCLDKLQLALKSDYFEKLFIEYSDQKECTLIELPVMDTDTFYTIVDIIYGDERTLTSVLNHDNYVNLLIAMDYLQMEIDMETYAKLIKEKSHLDTKIFRLYNFVQDNPNLQRLLQSVLKHLSGHLMEMRNNYDFLSLSIDTIVRIVLRASEVDELKSFVKKIREISEICSRWICHDLKSRLAHAAKLVNAAKQRLCHLNEIKDEQFNSMLPDTAGINLEMMTKVFYKFLVCDGEITLDSDHEKLLKDENKEVSCTDRGNIRKKLEENNYFYDVLVRVGDKTYKLHRYMLSRQSGYFAEIFSTQKSNVETSTQQPKPIENEYSLEDVDQTTFDAIVKYIYFDELQLTCETVRRVSRAAKILKMENLFGRCVQWMEANIEQVCEKILLIDECISASAIGDNIEKIYSKVVIERETGNTLPICLVSFDMLEDLLLFSSHCCDEPSKIVDLCSKWVFHDVQNRYHLIPRIALAINRNRECRETNVPTDLNDCSEQSIRDELWKILRLTALVPSAKKISQDDANDFHEIPVFVAFTIEATTITIHVLNADLEQITSMCISNSRPLERSVLSRYYCLEATLIDDNLFIILFLGIGCSRPSFYVYNLCLKKFISLNNGVLVKNPKWFTKYSLLNCRGQVYCCLEDGHVLKYSIELNRWMRFSEKPVFSDENLEKHQKDVWFTSDGDKLYRLYADRLSTEGYSSNLIYVVDEFNFQQNVWVSLSDFSSVRSRNEVTNLTIIGDKLTVVLESSFLSFDRNSRTWRKYSLSNTRRSVVERCFALVRCEDRLLHVVGNKLYQRCETNGFWVLKKELPTSNPVPVEYYENRGPYECISAIHKCIVRSD